VVSTTIGAVVAKSQSESRGRDGAANMDCVASTPMKTKAMSAKVARTDDTRYEYCQNNQFEMRRLYCLHGRSRSDGTNTGIDMDGCRVS